VSKNASYSCDEKDWYRFDPEQRVLVEAQVPVHVIDASNIKDLSPVPIPAEKVRHTFVSSPPTLWHMLHEARQHVKGLLSVFLLFLFLLFVFPRCFS
jgi:hypothetical protein